MRKELTKLLGYKYVVKGSDTNVEVFDASVVGYSNERNVALVRCVKGKLSINLNRGYHYKPLEFKEVRDLDEIKEIIENRQNKKH